MQYETKSLYRSLPNSYCLPLMMQAGPQRRIIKVARKHLRGVHWSNGQVNFPWLSCWTIKDSTLEMRHSARKIQWLIEWPIDRLIDSWFIWRLYTLCSVVRLAISELEENWKQATVTSCKVLSRHLPRFETGTSRIQSSSSIHSIPTFSRINLFHATSEAKFYLRNTSTKQDNVSNGLSRKSSLAWLLVFSKFAIRRADIPIVNSRFLGRLCVQYKTCPIVGGFLF
jgi:hypothetical protein